MNKSYSKLLPAVALLAFLLLCYALHPWLGYMLDSDAVAYLTIARRAAAGQWFQSINGLWSPLNSWLLIPFIQRGFDAWTVSKIINIVAGGLVLLQSIALIKKHIHSFFVQSALSFALIIVSAYQVYFQIFGDVLQLVFVLAYLRLLWSDRFTQTTWKAILCGLIMGIGFYAKAYTFVLFSLHYTLSLLWMYRQQMVPKALALKQWLLGGITFAACIVPWSVALYQKYHVFTLSGLGGKLNMSWYINSGKSFKSDIHLLIPPPYPDSPSFWEDPYLSQANLSGPLSSLHHFLLWIVRVVYTSLESILCIQEISFLGVIILALALYVFFKKKEKEASRIPVQGMIITCIVLPIGYLMMHVETRYLWLMIPLLAALGGLLIQSLLPSKRIQQVFALVLAFSFILFPIVQFKALRYKNKELFDKAAWIKDQHLQGSFTSNSADAGRMWVVAYLTKSAYYTIEKSGYTETELIDEMNRYGVKYYFFEAENNVIHQNISPTHFDVVAQGEGLVVYKLKHGI